MKLPNITKGNWSNTTPPSSTHNWRSIQSVKGYEIAAVPGSRGISAKERVADAKAIAATPKTLYALNELYEFACMYGASKRASSEDWSGFLEDARMALLEAGCTD